MSFYPTEFRLGAGLCEMEVGGSVLRGQDGPLGAFVLRGQGVGGVAKFIEKRLMLFSALIHP